MLGGVKVDLNVVLFAFLCGDTFFAEPPFEHGIGFGAATCCGVAEALNHKHMFSSRDGGGDGSKQ